MPQSVAIVGLGSVGRRHARNVLALGVTDVTLVRTGAGQARSLEPPLDALPVETTLAEALRRGVTAVVVANPTALHAVTALEAVRAGCHVLVEKPVSHESESLDVLQQELEERGTALLIGYQYRFHPTLTCVRDWVASGTIGDVVAAHAHWGEYLPAWHPGEDYAQGYSARADLGGGVVRTLSHPIDYLRWIVGEVDDLAGYTARRAGLGLEVEDTAAFSLRFDSGALGSLTLDYAERPPRHTLHVTGTDGRIEWDGRSGEASLWRANPVGRHAGEIGEPTLARPPDGFERNDMFLAEMRHFLACCSGAEHPLCTLQDGVRTLELALRGLRGGGGGGKW